MKLAYIASEERGLTDRVLSDLASELIARGWKVRGVAQTNSERFDSRFCDMDVKVLPNGATYRISQSLGPEARGCRLDPGNLELAVSEVEASLSSGGDILIINKFGKHEGDGRGFRPVIAEALARDIPVVLSVSRLSLASFLEFTGEAAERVAPELDALLDWIGAEPSERSAQSR